MKFILSFLCLSIIISFYYSCTKFQFEGEAVECATEVTYDDDIRTILNAKCSSNTACHAPSGNRPDYTDFDDMTISLNSGLFKTRVLDNVNDMPPASAPEFALDSSEMRKIRCWAENGYPKN